MEIPDNFKGVKSVYGDHELPNLNIFHVIFLFINFCRVVVEITGISMECRKVFPRLCF